VKKNKDMGTSEAGAASQAAAAPITPAQPVKPTRRRMSDTPHLDHPQVDIAGHEEFATVALSIERGTGASSSWPAMSNLW